MTATREGGSALLLLEGRLDREWAEHLSGALEDLVRTGARSLRIDLAKVTYVSSAATRVLTRWRQELAQLRGDLRLVSVSPEVKAGFQVVGWDPDVDGPATGRSDIRRSSWHARADLDRTGIYELSACTPPRTLNCRLRGDPDRLTRIPPGPDVCSPVAFPESVFGFGLGAIGVSFADCRDQMGELVAAAECVAYFPTGGARMADYLVGSGRVAPQAVLATGLTCEGGFSQLIRFSTRPDADGVPLSEVAAIGLEAAGGRLAGLVIAGETVGLCGARRRRSPADDGPAIRFEVPEVRDWLSFAPERTHPMTTSIVVGVVAQSPEGPLTAHLRPLGDGGALQGHFHAAVFSYHALPQRTVELPALLRRLFANHQLRDVLHLVWDDRGAEGVSESALLRGVVWAAPITEVC
jgi:anti-anti-sigma factor